MLPSDQLPGGCQWLKLGKFWDDRGALTPVESGQDIPFEIRRVFYFYDVPAGEKRGSHAHQTVEHVLIAISGSFDVILDDGERTEKVTCDRPWRGLYLAPMVWASQVNFAGGTVGLALASAHFAETDYIRDYREFRRVIAR